MERPKRPTSVTVIAWVNIAFGGISLVSMPLILITPESLRAMQVQGISPALTVATGIVGGVTYLVAGLALLKGLNWGRLLYVYCGLASMIFTLTLYGFQPIQIIGIALYLALVILLVRPGVSAYFGGGLWQRRKPSE